MAGNAAEKVQKYDPKRNSTALIKWNDSAQLSPTVSPIGPVMKTKGMETKHTMAE
ncbi:MAG: hypothetical protein SynsKO_22550 [Synoicihabitans sp.]